MAALDLTTILAECGYSATTDGSLAKLRLDRQRALVNTMAHGKYAEASQRGNLFMAHAIVTAPVIFSTAAGTGGPLLWNGSTTVKGSLLGVGVGVTTVTTVAAALGITGNSGQAAAPGSTTAIDSRANLLIGGASSAITPYRVGTPSAAGNFFLPLGSLHTGALTVDNFNYAWFDLDGLITIPPNAWASLAASATASTTVASLALVWEEIPV